MTADELLAMATRFSIPLDHVRDITVERTHWTDPRCWAVRRNGFCLSIEGAWRDEPMPSSRCAAFLDSCRFTNLADAIRAARLAASEEP